MKIFILATLFVFLEFSCQNPKVQNNQVAAANSPKEAAATTEVQLPHVSEHTSVAIKKKPTTTSKELTTTSQESSPSPSADAPRSGERGYPWLTEDYNPAQALQTRVPAPMGCHWVTEKNTISEWLAGIPLQPAGAQVHLYNGQLKNRQDVHFAVVNMDVGKADLQQCADAVMRLKAEYHYSRGEYAKIAFNLTSGDRVCFDDWRKGKKPVVKGNKVSFTAASGKPDNSYQNFKKYLTLVFSYAGSSSLSKEMKAKNLSEIKAGDVFIWGGFPGHAVMVMGVAERDKDGKRFFLLAQSYMPAQEMHLLKNLNDSKLSPWYPADFVGSLETPEWTFEKGDLKMFRD